jgi:hypothetical protein
LNFPVTCACTARAMSLNCPTRFLEWRGTKWFYRNSQMIYSNNENDISLERCQQGASLLYLTFVPNSYGLKLILEVLKSRFWCSLRDDGLNSMGEIPWFVVKWSR